MTAAVKPARFTKWQPKRWEAMHEQMVLMSTLGRSNVAIAEAFGYTPQHVCNVLNTPQADIIRRRVLNTLRESAVKQIDGSLEDLADQSIVRLKQVMYDDDLFSKSPFAVVDRGISVLRGIGKLRAENAPGVNVKNAIFMTPEDAKTLHDGMTRADEAKRLNPTPIEVEAKVG
jgi:hypothetical protein